MTKLKNKLYLLLIIFLASIVRLYGLETRPLDGDEGIMVLISHNTFVDLIKRASLDIHPPLYHILLKLFLNLGNNEWSVRLLSALPNIAAIYLIYILTKKLFEKYPLFQTLSRISSLFMAISPYLIYPAQEARMYSLFLFFSLGSYYFLWRLLEKTTDKPYLKFWLGYTIFSVLMLYTHYLGFIVLTSQFIYLIINKIFFKHSETKSRSLMMGSSRLYSNNIFRWILSWTTIIVLFLPQLPIMFSQFSARISEQSQALSIGENLKGLIGAFYRFGAGRIFLDLSPSGLKTMILDNPISFLIFVITFLVPLWLFIKGLLLVYKNYQKEFRFLVTPIVIAIILAVSSTEIGSRSSRYLIYIFPFYIIFLSFGFWHYWKKEWTIIIPILFIIINFSGLIYHYQYEIKAPGVDKIAEFISHDYKDGDIVLIRGGFGGGEQWVLNYYWKKLHVTRYTLHAEDMLGDYRAGNLAQLKSIKAEDRINELLADYNRVWFYDLTYETYEIPNAIKHSLGYDKEKKELIVWEVLK